MIHVDTTADGTLIYVQLYEGDEYNEPIKEWITRSDATSLTYSLADALGLELRSTASPFKTKSQTSGPRA